MQSLGWLKSHLTISRKQNLSQRADLVLEMSLFDDRKYKENPMSQQCAVDDPNFLEKLNSTMYSNFNNTAARGTEHKKSIFQRQHKNATQADYLYFCSLLAGKKQIKSSQVFLSNVTSQLSPYY